MYFILCKICLIFFSFAICVHFVIPYSSSCDPPATEISSMYIGIPVSVSPYLWPIFSPTSFTLAFIFFCWCLSHSWSKYWTWFYNFCYLYTFCISSCSVCNNFCSFIDFIKHFDILFLLSPILSIFIKQPSFNQGLSKSIFIVLSFFLLLHSLWIITHSLPVFLSCCFHTWYICFFVFILEFL